MKKQQIASEEERQSWYVKPTAPGPVDREKVKVCPPKEMSWHLY